MDDTKIEEYKSLRQEHENNRKFIFERPLLIVGATFASAMTVADKGFLVLLPIPFLALLLFNLWFTHNRAESSARIVSYLQLVHEGVCPVNWIGWENSVRLYRQWIYKTANERPEQDTEQFESMAFYGWIFYFHLFLGVILTLIIVFNAFLLESAKGQLRPLVLTFLTLDALAFVAFLIGSLSYRPSTVRHQIEFKRRVWEKVLKAKGSAPALFVTLEEARRDPALSTRGERKQLVTEIRSDTEEEAREVVWSHTSVSGKCPVQVTKGVESATFTQLAKQTRHCHEIGTEIYLLLQGKMTIEVEGIEYHMTEGDMIVVNPGSFHEVRREEDFLCRVVTANAGGPQDKRESL